MGLACSFVGRGMSASSPNGFSGVSTMKMISSTRRTSISGVTFITAAGFRDEPRFMAMAKSPRTSRGVLQPIDTATPAKFPASASSLERRRRDKLNTSVIMLRDGH